MLSIGLSASPAVGQPVVPCDGLFDVTMISEPWESYSRSFAQGAIRVFEAYIAPTMAAGAVIGVIHPIPGDPYFAEALISQAGAEYDPARALVLRIPVRFPDGAEPIDMVEVTVNQAIGTVVTR
jgi:hypothetical protein